MNRQMKRMQEREERRKGATAGERREAAATSARRGAAVARTEGKKKRAGVREFLKEVRQELRRVDWPTRQELISYTVVVLVTVVVMMAFVYGLDYIFAKVILKVLGN